MRRALVLGLLALGGPALAETPPAEPEEEESPPVAPEEEAPPAEPEEDLVEALEARLEALEERLAAERRRAARERLESMPPDRFHFEVEGHYRTRGYLFSGMFDQDRPATYMEHRLRVRPIASYRGLARLAMEIDALDNVVWGDNASLATTAVFAGDPSATSVTGRTLPSVALNRVWLEMDLPVGQLRVGRQPSHWGLGILANDGDGFEPRFGENRAGNTFDRVLFATRPLSIVDAIRGVEDREIPLIAGVGVDRLVTSPQIRYYGYRCQPGIPETDDRYRPECDRSGDGVTDADHGFTDDRFTEDRRGHGWWTDPDQAVMEMVYVLLYQGEDLDLFGLEGDLTAGTYVVHRVQGETDSNILILDGYLDATIEGVIAQAEVVHIRGQTRAITLPGAVGAGDDPLAKTADIWGYVLRGGYEQPGWKVLVEHGHASGDDNVADARFTGRPLHEDYNVGLLLYQEVLRRVTASVWTEAADGLWSQGGVYNSRYLFPTVHLTPLENWELLAGLVLAWPHQADGAIIRETDAALLGWEVDVGLKHRWHEHLHFSLEVGYAQVTDRLPLSLAGLDPEGRFFTVQSRIGWLF